MRGEVPDMDDIVLEEEASKAKTFKDGIVLGRKWKFRMGETGLSEWTSK